MEPGEPMSTPVRPSSDAWRGSCILLYAYDIGQNIDLECAAGLIRETTQPEKLKHRVHAPRYFQFQPAPLRVSQESVSQTVERWRTQASVELVIYDFGAVSVSYEIPFAGPLEEWIELGCALQDSDALAADALRRVRALAGALEKCVSKADVADLSEDYVLFQFSATALESEELLARHGAELARLLRAERQPLSRQEVHDALSAQVAFSRSDLALIDWNAAVLFDDEPDDVRAVLEFANVQLLEMRFLDHLLDLNLDQAYLTLGQRPWRRLWTPASFEHDLEKVSRLQVDGAILFERVSNALKLLNDQYLARAYRLSSKRFHLGEWNASILRKLDTLENIYQKIQDRADARRMEFLEWIIIALILISIALPLLTGSGGP
jgi:hypothetical protein